MSNLFSPSPCAMVIYGLYCSMKEMIKKENIFKVTKKSKSIAVNSLVKPPLFARSWPMAEA
jgi:hypothetical protein